MGNWRYFNIRGSIPKEYTDGRIREYINNTDDFRVFQCEDIKTYPWDEEHVYISGTIGKCYWDGIDDIIEESKLLHKQFPLIDIKMEIGDEQCRVRKMAEIWMDTFGIFVYSDYYSDKYNDEVEYEKFDEIIREPECRQELEYYKDWNPEFFAKHEDLFNYRFPEDRD